MSKNIYAKMSDIELYYAEMANDENDLDIVEEMCKRAGLLEEWNNVTETTIDRVYSRALEHLEESLADENQKCIFEITKALDNDSLYEIKKGLFTKHKTLVKPKQALNQVLKKFSIKRISEVTAHEIAPVEHAHYSNDDLYSQEVLEWAKSKMSNEDPKKIKIHFANCGFVCDTHNPKIFNEFAKAVMQAEQKVEQPLSQ